MTKVLPAAGSSISSAPSRIQHVELALAGRGELAGNVEAALLRHEAEVEAGDARSRRVQHVERVPAGGVLALDGAERDARRHAEDRRAVGARGDAGADDDQRPLRALQRLGERVLAVGQLAQRLRAGAHVLIGVGELRRLADDADLEAALAPALQDARVEHRRLEARIGADEQDRVGLVDAGDGRS